MKKLTFEFANAEARRHFVEWLCGSGEQQYWQWMDCREEEEDGEITVLKFDYGVAKVTTKVGRLDK